MRTWVFIKILSSGIVSAAAAVLIYLALSCLVRIKEKWWYKGILFLGCGQASFMIIYIGDMFNLSCSMPIFLIAFWICCQGTGLKKFTLGLMFASMVFAFNAFWDNSVGYMAASFGIDDLYEQMYLVGRLAFAVFLYLQIRFLKVEKDFELSAPLWRLMLLLSFSPLGIMVSVIMLSSPYTNLDSIVLADSVLFLVVMLSFIGLLRALIVLERQQRIETENLLAHQNRRYYEAMEQQQFEIRRLRHDLSNHLQALLALPEQKRDEYIKGMLDNPAFGQILTWCGDSTINAVLTTKGELMRQKGVRFLPKVDIAEELPFEKADICAIFANALDNAVENCMQLEESMREIHLDAKAGKGILAVNIKNTCKSNHTAGLNKKPAGKEELPRTTKEDAKNHGFGLRSIRETVRKYGGSMEIQQKEESFNLFLYLPIPAAR